MYRCRTPHCGRQEENKPAPGFKCPHCLAVDSYDQVSSRAGNNNSASEEYELKRRGQHYDFMKFFLGTFLIGLAGTAMTWVFKTYELEMESKKNDAAYIQSYLTTYLASVENQKYDHALEMVHFVKLFTKDEELRNAWDSLGLLVTGKIEGFKEQERLLAEQSQQRSDELRDARAKEASLREQRANGDLSEQAFVAAQSEVQQEIDSIEEKLVEVGIKQQLLKKDVQQALVNPQKVGIILPLATAPAYEVVYEQDRWTGKGYFSRIAAGITVHVQNYSTNYDAATMEVRFPGEEARSVRIPVGETRQVRSDGEGYIVSIRLIAIKNMGRSVLGALSREASYNIKVERKKDGEGRS